MLIQNYDEKTDCESYPEGYLDALEDCAILAADLLQKAIKAQNLNKCWDCTSWVGRCLKGNVNRIAHDETCNDFSPKTGIE